MIYGPRFAEMRDPSLIPAPLGTQARAARERPLDPLNLWNLSWKADGAIPFSVLPEALTGVAELRRQEDPAFWRAEQERAFDVDRRIRERR